MQSSTELELLRMVTDTREDFAKLLAVSDETRLKIIKIETHLEKLNGNVAKHSQGLAEAIAWQKAHAADHKEVTEEREEKSRQRVEIFKAAPPYLTWVLNLVVIVLLLTGVNVPTAVARIVDVPVPLASPHPAPPAVTETEVVVHPTTIPRPSATPRPTPTGELGDTDRDYLARLCVVEVRDMAEKRADACLSVISTVMTRISAGQMSDGTVAGTITRNCFPDTLECQFPAYTVNGCEGILSTACPHNYPEDIAYFLKVVGRYFDDGERGSCSGYLFYWLLKAQDCRIESASGRFTNWYRKAER